eukprot:130624-Prorocentrum_minimum.AAC.1
MTDKAWKFAIDEGEKALRQKEKILTNLRKESAELVALTRSLAGNSKEHKTCSQLTADFQGGVADCPKDQVARRVEP